jgi:hypothetical protein
VVTFNAFCALMEEVLGARRGPRAYLAPSPPRKQLPTESYTPKINQRSKQLASRVRPKVRERGCGGVNTVIVREGRSFVAGWVWSRACKQPAGLRAGEQQNGFAVGRGAVADHSTQHVARTLPPSSC